MRGTKRAETSRRGLTTSSSLLFVLLLLALLLAMGQLQSASLAALLPMSNANTSCRQYNNSPSPPLHVPSAQDKGHSLFDSNRLRVIQRAGSVDISFNPALILDREVHPYKGAVDEVGNPGYKADPTFLRQAGAKPFDFPQLKAACEQRDDTYKMLTNRVFVDLAADREADARVANGTSTTGTTTVQPRPKILCVLFTVDQDHPKLEATLSTWGPKCDGIIFGSNLTDPSIGTVNVLHEGPEEYNNIWQKVRSLWAYVYENYYDQYDYFHSGGTDIYLLVENLRLYLESEEIRLASNGGVDMQQQQAEEDKTGGGHKRYQTPLFLGRRFRLGGGDDIFIAGGSGYTMNKAALKTLISRLPVCQPKHHGFEEDVMIAQCFREVGILPYDTKDEDGSERYMPFRPGDHMRVYSAEELEKKDDWYLKYCIDCKWGEAHCSPRSVAFHGIEPYLMKRMHAILYGYCDEFK